MLQESSQYMHMKNKEENKDNWFFIAVYANPASEKKAVLWGDLKWPSDHVSGVWMIAGDLNDIRDPREMKGGAPFNWSRAQNFK